MFGAQVDWPSALVAAAFILGLFWFLGRAVSLPRRTSPTDAFWAYKSADVTAPPQLLAEMAELREDVRALRSRVEELHRILQAVE